MKKVWSLFLVALTIIVSGLTIKVVQA
ncbi:MAG: hypothetical protein QG609_607, partial [Patescibacteria group bacterium]|nr:hypothetical protein [Patescibacteria group bacterium]